MSCGRVRPSDNGTMLRFLKGGWASRCEESVIWGSIEGAIGTPRQRERPRKERQSRPADGVALPDPPFHTRREFAVPLSLAECWITDESDELTDDRTCRGRSNVMALSSLNIYRHLCANYTSDW